MKPEQAFSDRSRTTDGQPLQNQMPQPLRLPEEDRAWARRFINNITAADDDEGLQQVVAITTMSLMTCPGVKPCVRN